MPDPARRVAGCDRGYDGTMTTSQQPAPVTLLPVGEDKNLLAVNESAGSCCGGSACGTAD